MGGANSVHVANASSRVILVRVTQEKVVLKELKTSGDATVGFKFGDIVDAHTSVAVGAEFVRVSYTEGFVRLGPRDALVYDRDSKKIFVTVLTTDEPTPLPICENYCPSRSRSSVVITENNTVRNSKLLISVSRHCSGGNSERQEERKMRWITEDGVNYTADMAVKIYRQSDIDKNAQIVVAGFGTTDSSQKNI